MIGKWSNSKNALTTEKLSQFNRVSTKAQARRAPLNLGENHGTPPTQCKCRDLLRMLGNPRVCHEGRTCNRAADKLAKAGRRMKTNQLFEEWSVLPLFIVGLLK
ncbi:uncharacterized protein LOC124897055 [Capsicum annuum]|uniref:uncharacterized protein LOC124897055 n=1 Tax=Capsicum annuum TaxID=4072 RepID=UPI001FB0FD06|nr:uncharacterized protein LOC124897055 [Capsicum annuum]